MIAACIARPPFSLFFFYSTTPDLRHNAFWLQMDEVLAGIVEKIKNFAIIYLV